jgi:hypothetical protein
LESGQTSTSASARGMLRPPWVDSNPAVRLIVLAVYWWLMVGPMCSVWPKRPLLRVRARMLVVGPTGGPRSDPLALWELGPWLQADKTKWPDVQATNISTSFEIDLNARRGKEMDSA